MASSKDIYPSYEVAKARMRERYHSDPEYRAKKIAYAKKYAQEHYSDNESKMILSIKRKEYYKRKKLRNENRN